MAKVRRFRYIKLFMVVILLYLAMLSIPGFLKLLYPLEHKGEIIKYGRMHNIDPPLLAALIKTESDFRIDAESHKGAKGLMQITPSTGAWIAESIGLKGFEEQMLFQPEINIMLGSWYIEHLSDYYNGNFVLVFAAYNGGRGNVDKWLKDKSLSQDGKNLDSIPFSETENFVKKLDKNYYIYRHIYNWDVTE